MVQLQAGTPAQTHLLLFDTGSGTSWIADKKCADGACNNISRYMSWFLSVCEHSRWQTMG